MKHILSLIVLLLSGKKLLLRFLNPLGIITLLLIFLSFTSLISSCTKTNTVFDTTIITRHDTTIVIKHDTTITKDSIYDLTDGLVAYYSFNGGSLSDSSGYNNNITFNNATKTTDRFGNPNNAYLFNGTSSYMMVPNSYSLNPDNITMYAIVNVTGFYAGVCSENQIIIKGPEYQTNGLYGLAFGDSAAHCGPQNLSNETFSGGYGDDVPIGVQAGVTDYTPIITGQWYYVAFTYDGLVAKLYINGILKGTQTRMINFTDNGNNVYFGKTENPTYPYYFNGVIDEIRIYNRALPANTIKYLVASGN